MSHELANGAPIQLSLHDALACAQNECGSMSLVTPDARLAMYITGSSTGEITDFRLDVENPQALMAGQLLLSNLEKQARDKGLTELVVTSGPNANATAIEFWNRVFGKPVATADDYDGPNFARFIWRKQLSD